MKTSEIFQFKISLNGSRPAIWRRILIPSDYTFFELHCAIQDAMGWTDCHLHAFRFGDKNNRRKQTSIMTSMPEDDDWDDIIDERFIKVNDYFGKVFKQCIYDYDFGDSWEHTVVLEKTLSAITGNTYPQCIAGKNACPSEDCGGLGGYDHLIAVMKHPKHPDHNDMLDWLCIENADEFDPTAFDPTEIVFENMKKRLVEWNKHFGKPTK